MTPIKKLYIFALIGMSSLLWSSCESNNQNSVNSPKPPVMVIEPEKSVNTVNTNIINSSTDLQIDSPQGKIAANTLLLEITTDKDLLATEFILKNGWIISWKNEEIIKITVDGSSYESLLTHKLKAEESWLFSLVEFVGYIGLK